MKFFKILLKFPKVVIGVCIAVTAFFGFFLKDLALENSIRSFYPQKDASFDRLIETEETFGSMLSIGIILETKDGTSILTPEYIDVARKIAGRVDLMPEIENIDSIGTIDFVSDEDGAISAHPLIPDDYQGTLQEVDALRQRIAEWHEMYNRVIINDTYTGFQMNLSLAPKSEETIALEAAEKAIAENKAILKNEEVSEEEKAAAAEALNAAKIARKEAKSKIRQLGTDIMRQQDTLNKIKVICNEELKEAGKGLKLTLVGDPVMSDKSKEYMVKDLIGLIPLVVVVVIISLFMSLKTVPGTVLPLSTVVMATAISVGLMGLMNVTFSLVASVIPVALIAVGSAYGIHVLTHYYIALHSVEGELTREKYEECVFQGLDEVKLAVILAGITTIVGFVSLVTSPLGPLHNFAIFTAVGIAISLVLSVTFIPAVLLCMDYKKALMKQDKFIDKLSGKVKKRMLKARERLERRKMINEGKDDDEQSGESFWHIYKFFCGSATRVNAMIILLVALGIWGLYLLKIDTALINYFPKKSEFRQDIDYVDSQYAGTNSIFFNITGPEKGDICNVELLKAVENMEKYLDANFDNIGKIVSFTTFVKRINQVWHAPTASVLEDSSSAASADDGFDASFGFDDFGFEGFEGFETEPVEAEAPVDFVDPNIEFYKNLQRTYTTEEFMQLLYISYLKAGGNTSNLDDVIESLMKELNYNGMAYHEIPYDPAKYPVADKEGLRNVVENYLTLLSGSLGRFIDDDMNPKTMRITCQLRSHSSGESGVIIEAAKAYAEEYFPEGYTLEATGSAQMEHRMTSMIISSQIASLLLSLGSVFIIIAISFKSVKAGLIGALPLAFCILLNYLTMALFNISLDFLTSIIASLAVGVGIDYTIHFMTTYREERRKTNDLAVVTKNTFKKSGAGIMTNALAVGLGFLVLCLSKFIILRYIGILVAIVMFTSSFLSLTIIPGILNLLDPEFMHREEKKDS